MDLINGILNGDQTAEEELREQYIEQIKTIVRSHLGNRSEDREDLVQEIDIAVIKKLRDRKYRPEEGPLGSYVYGIAKNKISGHFKTRKKKGFVEDISEKEIPNNAEIHERVESEEPQNIMRNELEKLKAEYKEVLVLRYYRDLPIEEIAEKLGISKKRVSERIYYATKLLRKKCKKFFP